MNIKNIFLIAIIFSLFFFEKQNCLKASEFIQSREDFFLKCFPDKSNFHSIPMPKKFHPNNNLLKDSNKNIYAIGQKMILEGYIVDQNCTPIPNAIVKIWQKNNFGYYQNGFDKKNLSKDAFEIQKKINHHNQFFIGNGVSTTDNLGYFHFITLVPCLDTKTSSKCIPEIEISVSSGFNKNASRFEGRILIPEIDRKNKNKIFLLNKHYFQKEYIADLLEFKKNYLRFRYDVCLKERISYRKH